MRAHALVADRRLFAVVVETAGSVEVAAVGDSLRADTVVAAADVEAVRIRGAFDRAVVLLDNAVLVADIFAGPDIFTCLRRLVVSLFVGDADTDIYLVAALLFGILSSEDIAGVVDIASSFL